MSIILKTGNACDLFSFRRDYMSGSFFYLYLSVRHFASIWVFFLDQAPVCIVWQLCTQVKIDLSTRNLFMLWCTWSSITKKRLQFWITHRDRQTIFPMYILFMHHYQGFQ